MRKYILLSIVFLSIVLPAKASITRFSGTFLTGKVGYIGFRSKTFTTNPNGAGADMNNIFDSGYVGIAASRSAFLGDMLYAALCGEFTFDNIGKGTTVGTNGVTIEASAENSLGLGLRAGVPIGTSVVYALLKSVSAKFMIRSQHQALVPKRFHKRKFGVVIGLGAMFPITRKIIASGTFTHTMQRHLNLVHTNGVQAVNIRMKPTINRFDLGIHYKL